jgi:hypothetical protein
MSKEDDFLLELGFCYVLNFTTLYLKPIVVISAMTERQPFFNHIYGVVHQYADHIMAILLRCS